MNNTIKKLLTEMTQIINVKDPSITYFAKALNEDKGETRTAVSVILLWIDPAMTIPLNNSKKFTFSEIAFEKRGDILYNRYKNLFTHCPELKELLTLNKEYLNFNPNLSSEEKEEIIQFVDENTSNRITSEYR